LAERFDLRLYLDVYSSVISEIDLERRVSGIEITCHERFVRTLSRLEVPLANGGHDLAGQLTRAHMAAVRGVTTAPPAHQAAVRRVAARFRVGLLSNFDDAETGRAILLDTGVSDLFETVILSAEVGVRKPNPVIFWRLLDALRLAPPEVLFVGDTPRDDVLGAKAVGIPVAWIAEGKGALPEGIPEPDFTLANLTTLPALLGLE
jgi:FMN phosphatase YigB (HAD superfamily)